MYSFYHSKLVNEDKEQWPPKFIKERFYSKEFIIEELSEEFMKHLQNVKPAEGQKLGNAPPNLFMPQR